MQYLKFRIENYRAITKPLEVDVSRHPLIPIIGVNESGKTTILHAIFALDGANDHLNDGRHLEDTENLYSLESPPALVTAVIDLNAIDLVTAIKAFTSDERLAAIRKQLLDRAEVHEGPVAVTRNLRTRTYSTDLLFTDDERIDALLASRIISQMPYILFFDDFRDSVDDRIEIKAKDDEILTGWLAIMERLFSQAADGFSVLKVPGMEERQRRTLLSRVNKHLNDTLTREWHTFRIDDTEALQIEVTFEQETDGDNVTRSFLMLSIAERTADEQQYYFHIRDRSKGFFWFFNFVMKLEFNPKFIQSYDEGTVYLLDEPGSYLHSGAQRRLCKKLVQLSSINRVIYCTHSHYLLDPNIIPLGSVAVAQKDSSGSITLDPIHSYKGTSKERRSAFQPVLDALEVPSFSLEIGAGPVLITEGIIDYYAIQMFKGSTNLVVLPGNSADSIQYHASRLIALDVPFKALWDNDKEGHDAQRRAEKHLGSEIAKRHFRTLPLRGTGAKKRIMQDLFDGDDLRTIRTALDIPYNAQFDKTIMLLFYNPDRETILDQLTGQTQSNFDALLTMLDM